MADKKKPRTFAAKMIRDLEKHVAKFAPRAAKLTSQMPMAVQKVLGKRIRDLEPDESYMVGKVPKGLFILEKRRGVVSIAWAAWLHGDCSSEMDDRETPFLTAMKPLVKKKAGEKEAKKNAKQVGDMIADLDDEPKLTVQPDSSIGGAPIQHIKPGEHGFLRSMGESFGYCTCGWPGNENASRLGDPLKVSFQEWSDQHARQYMKLPAEKSWPCGECGMTDAIAGEVYCAKCIAEGAGTLKSAGPTVTINSEKHTYILAKPDSSIGRCSCGWPSYGNYASRMQFANAIAWKAHVQDIAKGIVDGAWNPEPKPPVTVSFEPRNDQSLSLKEAKKVAKKLARRGRLSQTIEGFLRNKGISEQDAIKITAEAVASHVVFSLGKVTESDRMEPLSPDETADEEPAKKPKSASACTTWPPKKRKMCKGCGGSGRLYPEGVMGAPGTPCGLCAGIGFKDVLDGPKRVLLSARMCRGCLGSCFAGDGRYEPGPRVPCGKCRATGTAPGACPKCHTQSVLYLVQRFKHLGWVIVGRCRLCFLLAYRSAFNPVLPPGSHKTPSDPVKEPGEGFMDLAATLCGKPARVPASKRAPKTRRAPPHPTPPKAEDAPSHIQALTDPLVSTLYQLVSSYSIPMETISPTHSPEIHRALSYAFAVLLTHRFPRTVDASLSLQDYGTGDQPPTFPVRKMLPALLQSVASLADFAMQDAPIYTDLQDYVIKHVSLALMVYVSARVEYVRAQTPLNLPPEPPFISPKDTIAKAPVYPASDPPPGRDVGHGVHSNPPEPPPSDLY